MKMLVLTDILTIVAIAVGMGVLLTAASRRSLTNPALMLFAGLCLEIICAMTATEWLRGSEWEQVMRTAGRVVEILVIANFVRYLLSYGDDKHVTKTPGGFGVTPPPRNTRGRNDRIMSGFKWDKKKGAVALSLASGMTQMQAAEEHAVADRTIRRWLDDPEFSAEVDRLSLMTGIASRAERLRIAKRVIKQLTPESGRVDTEKDALDWLKFAQSETDGIKLDLSKLAALGVDDTPVAD